MKLKAKANPIILFFSKKVNSREENFNVISVVSLSPLGRCSILKGILIFNRFYCYIPKINQLYPDKFN